MGHRRMAALVALTALAASPSSHAELSVTKLRQSVRLSEKGNRALQAGNVRKARELYLKAVAGAPKLPEAHLGLGHIAMRERRFEDALREYREARDGYVFLGDALFQEAERRYHRAQEKLANNRIRIAELSRSRPRTPQEAVIISRSLAQLRQEQQRLERVEPPLTGDGTARAPGEVYFYIGNALGNLNDHEGALEAWETCRAISPNFAPVYNNLAVIYLKTNRFEDAAAYVEKAEELGLTVNPGLKADIERGLLTQQASAGRRE